MREKFFLSLLLITCVFFQSGCALMKNKTLITGAIGFTACSLVGAHNAPKDEKSFKHGMYYGSACAAASMAAVEAYKSFKTIKNKTKSDLISYSEEEDLNELKIRNSLIKSPNFKSFDEDIREKIQGKWQAYKTSNWIYTNDKLVHENLEIEFKKK